MLKINHRIGTRDYHILSDGTPTVVGLDIEWKEMDSADGADFMAARAVLIARLTQTIDNAKLDLPPRFAENTSRKGRHTGCATQ